MPDLEASWTRVRGFMREQCGVVIAPEQIYLLEARLMPVARRHEFSSVEAYVEAACAPCAPRPLCLSLIDAMTTHETFFFRDAPYWQLLETQILPSALSKLGRGQPLRVWCAACATGQEPYSLAMLLADKFPDAFQTAEILATDVSELSLEQAAAANYSTLDVNRGLHATKLVRFFEQVPGGFRVRESLRKRIVFRYCNLLDPCSGVPLFDIIMCRNVLIYFSAEDRDKVINRLYGVLRRDGYFGVGSTETVRGQRLTAGWYANQKVGE